MKKCLECGKECKRKFCNNRCSGYFNGRLSKQKTIIQSVCKSCGITFKHSKSILRKFCSCHCTQVFNNTLRRKYDIKYCQICNKQLNNPHKKFCTKKCFSIYLKSKTNYKIETGEFVSSSTLRRYLIERRGEKCERCGWTEINPTTDMVPVQVHHKDGHSINNKFENLELLCPNCHSLTSTFGALNVGNGREERRKRYKKIASLV